MSQLLGWLPLLLFALSLLMLLASWLAGRGVRRHLGRPVPGLAALGPESQQGSRLLYLFAPGCSVCRGLEPLIERLARERPGRLMRVDLSEQRALARELGVRVVPTLVRLEAGCLREVVTGAPSERRLRALLEASND